MQKVEGSSPFIRSPEKPAVASRLLAALIRRCSSNWRYGRAPLEDDGILHSSAIAKTVPHGARINPQQLSTTCRQTRSTSSSARWQNVRLLVSMDESESWQETFEVLSDESSSGR